MSQQAEYVDITGVAKLIRAELKDQFPDTKFSVRSSRYSMGSNVRVGWTDGPASWQALSRHRPSAARPHSGRQAMTPTCPKCGSALHCLACIGKVGGSTSSPKKTKAARRNARRPRPRKPP